MSRKYEKKAAGDTSVLAEMFNQLFEGNYYANATKGGKGEVNDGHLVFLSNTTEASFEAMLGASELKDLGALNRFFFIVSSKERVRKGWPENDARGGGGNGGDRVRGVAGCKSMFKSIARLTIFAAKVVEALLRHHEVFAIFSR